MLRGAYHSIAGGPNHFPFERRPLTCSRYAIGSGGVFRLCRRVLQSQQAATMFSAVSRPPPHRARRCSAVHLSGPLAADGDIGWPQYQHLPPWRMKAASRSFLSSGMQTPKIDEDPESRCNLNRRPCTRPLSERATDGIKRPDPDVCNRRLARELLARNPVRTYRGSASSQSLRFIAAVTKPPFRSICRGLYKYTRKRRGATPVDFHLTFRRR